MCRPRFHPYQNQKLYAGIILITEPFFADEELEKKAKEWVEWANNSDPSEYDLFYRKEAE